MKSWIPSFIKESKHALLIYLDKQSTKSIPVFYSYENGHLVFPLSILNPEIIRNLEFHENVSLYIADHIKSLSIQGIVTINQSSLNNESKELHELFRGYLQTIPFLKKYVWVDFVPQYLQAKDGKEMEIIELEIL